MFDDFGLPELGFLGCMIRGSASKGAKEVISYLEEQDFQKRFDEREREINDMYASQIAKMGKNKTN